MILDQRWLPQVLWHSPPGLGRHLSSGREGAQMSGAETGSAPEVVSLLPVPEAVSFCSPHSQLDRLLFSFLFFQDRISLCSCGCPGIQSVVQAALELRNLPASASQVLGLKACATMPGSISLILKPFNPVVQ